MKPEATSTLRDLALAHPAAARILESYHLDYCCGGKQTLGEACLAAGLNADEVVAAVQRAQCEGASEPRWDEASLTALMRFIVDTHHAFTRTELTRSEALLAKVIARHSDAHPELRNIGDCFGGLKAELGPHLLKEEQVLFPYIEALESHHRQETSLPSACFGTIDNPIRMMTMEHEVAGNLLKQIRTLANHFAPPADACPTYRALYQALEGLETDLMRHIHLENNVLFPRAHDLAGSV